jgi:hypothetical protein
LYHSQICSRTDSGNKKLTLILFVTTISSVGPYQKGNFCNTLIRKKNAKFCWKHQNAQNEIENKQENTENVENMENTDNETINFIQLENSTQK